MLYETLNVGLFPAVEAYFNDVPCAVLCASVTANANGWSKVEVNAQLNAEPNADANAKAEGKHLSTDLNMVTTVIASDKEINCEIMVRNGIFIVFFNTY